MEDPLLVNYKKEEVDKIRWEKLKKVASMAAPMVVVNISQTLLQATSTMIVGHKSEISLAGIALASSIANVTGFSLLSGLASALETLCGQAFGARQYEKLDSFCLLPLAHTSFIRILCTSVVDSLLPNTKLDFSYGFGTKGAALSISLSYWLNAVFLWFFMRRSQVCEGKCVFISMEAFGQMRTFFSLAVPSALMICLEWSAFEILILISGVLPNSKLETSVISMCVTSSSLHYNLASAIGAAASTNVANELGAGNLVAAKASAFVAIMIAAVESSSVSFALFMSSNIWGYAYSNVPEVIHYAAEITPVLCISIVMDSLSASLTGVVRGSGKQKTGAYVNIAAFYIIGIPIGLLFCFMLDFKVKGLWIGVLTGCTVQTITLFLITTFTKWTSMATEVSTV
uniref:Protein DETOXIFICATION n=1 Tax=Brassica oleracea TaxID=3712 RepID=A0A3P6H0S0_BRAOL|nr:unnamed protein product [Brassica oleracea]